jgi:hypothetical protein
MTKLYLVTLLAASSIAASSNCSGNGRTPVGHHVKVYAPLAKTTTNPTLDSPRNAQTVLELCWGALAGVNDGVLTASFRRAGAGGCNL